MGQQTLTAQIVLSGRVDSSFGPVSAALDRVANRALAVASGINNVSQPLLRTGKEVTQLYAGFDDAMKYIQAVSNLTTSQLNAVEDAARNAGKTTRYSATAAAEALGYGAEAGLEYAENIGLLPTVLNMAAAGNMELEKSMDQLLTIIYNTGTPLSEAGTLVDQLAVAASSSKTDIESMGEAVARLGGISRYAKGGNSELLTMLAMMAQRGQEGSEAGTYLRNVMLALIAPTKGAAKVMQELAFTEEEMEEALDGVNLSNAAKQIDDLKLSVYDDDGHLRSMVDILWDLKTITDDMTEKERNNVLGTIFPKRTLSAAVNLMGELDTSYERITESIDNANGAAKRMADTRESGVGGALRRLKNAADELKLSFGEEMADKIDTWSDSLRDFSLALSEMPEESKDFLIDVGSAVAFMGPAAMFAGMTLKGLSSILGFIGTPYGAVIAGAIALGLVVTNLNLMAEKDRYNAIQRHFGILEVDAEALAQAVSGLDGGMSTALSNLDKYGQASENAGGKYTTLLQTLSGDINSAIIFDQTIDDKNKQKLLGLGDSMVAAVKEGIAAKRIQMQEFASLLFAGDTAGEIEANLSLDQYFTGLIGEASLIGEEIRSKMTEALRDGKLDANEWEAIQTSVDRLNEIQAQIQNITTKSETYALLEKSKRLGLPAFNESKDAFIAQQSDIRNRTNTLYDEYIGTVIAAEEELDKTGQGKYTDDELVAYVEDLRKKRDHLLTESLSGNSQAAMELIDLIHDENFSDIQAYAKIYDQEVDRIMRENPGMDLREARGEAAKSDKLPKIDKSKWDAYNTWMAGAFELVNSLDIAAARKSYIENGQSLPEWITEWDGIYDLFMSTLGGADWRTNLGDKLNANYGYLYSNEAYTQWKTSDVEEGNKGYGLDISQFGDIISIPIVLNPQGEGAESGILRDKFGGLIEQGRRLGIETGWAFNGGFNGTVGGPGNLSAGGGGTSTPEEFAEGGRAVEASIFGEAGPEWAIPEAHTERTAALLNEAREASGFTWAELIGANGGLGGGNTYHYGGPVFAPVVYAQDAKGVKEVLQEEYEKFKRFYDDYEDEKERKRWQ